MQETSDALTSFTHIVWRISLLCGSGMVIDVTN